VRVAAVQLNSTADRVANLAVADRLTRAAAADGASLILLPEKWTAIGSDDQLRAAAEPLDGPSVQWAREIARARSSVCQWSRVVASVKAAGTRSTRAPSTARIR